MREWETWHIPFFYSQKQICNKKIFNSFLLHSKRLVFFFITVYSSFLLQQLRRHCIGHAGAVLSSFSFQLLFFFFLLQALPPLCRRHRRPADANRSPFTPLLLLPLAYISGMYFNYFFTVGPFMRNYIYTDTHALNTLYTFNLNHLFWKSLFIFIFIYFENLCQFLLGYAFISSSLLVVLHRLLYRLRLRCCNKSMTMLCALRRCSNNGATPVTPLLRHY